LKLKALDLMFVIPAKAEPYDDLRQRQWVL
jgi:hypothetical protein